MRKLGWLCLLLPGFARAEEGLSVGRVTAGLAAAPGAMSTPLGAVSARGDYHVFEHLGLTAGATWVRHPGVDALGVGAGPLLVFQPGFWTRLTLRAQPEWLNAWDRSPGGGRRGDLAFSAGAGVEYLLTWGVGFSAELAGTQPVGLGGAPRGPASIQLLAGLFTEF